MIIHTNNDILHLEYVIPLATATTTPSPKKTPLLTYYPH